jgi:adenosylmethionine-8-amino-7-oxononanoate aminotransferase
VVTIGHGVREITEAMAEQGNRLAYTHSSQFQTRAGLDLAEFLGSKLPGSRVWFTSGGSEATETALKLSRQYWLAQGQPERWRVIGRRVSYHGATLGALAVSGNARRREPYLPLLGEFAEHIAPCFCHHCELHLTFPECRLACADELEQAIERFGPESVAAFICEPVVGASSGAVPAAGYLRRVREICDRYGVLFIADEILCGCGRTGTYFALEQEGVTADLVLLGKGLTSGYAPLGAVLASERVWQPIAAAGAPLHHGFTYQAHPPTLAAGLAVQRYLEKHCLVDQARRRGEYLAGRLEAQRALSTVSDVRGRGLLHAVEVKPPVTAEAVAARLRERGVMVYPMPGHFLVTPPFIITEEQIDCVVSEIAAALEPAS